MNTIFRALQVGTSLAAVGFLAAALSGAVSGEPRRCLNVDDVRHGSPTFVPCD